jgi:hypothetical protein
VSRHFSNRKAILLIDGIDARGVVVAGGVDLFGNRVADQIGEECLFQNIF